MIACRVGTNTFLEQVRLKKFCRLATCGNSLCLVLFHTHTLSELSCWTAREAIGQSHYTAASGGARRLAEVEGERQGFPPCPPLLLGAGDESVVVLGSTRVNSQLLPSLFNLSLPPKVTVGFCGLRKVRVKVLEGTGMEVGAVGGARCFVGALGNANRRWKNQRQPSSVYTSGLFLNATDVWS